MTDEQIKQNAEEYLKQIPYYGELLSPMTLQTIKETYIAGAHSRDEEIEELQNELESLRKGFYERGDKLKELMLANNKLRNPWISVEERLPEEDADNISVTVAAITNKGYWFKGQYDYNNKDWFFSEDPDHLDFETDEFVTHWMPIHKINKGE